MQFRSANDIIENHVYAERHEKVREARKLSIQAQKQMELLKNDVQRNDTSYNQSEFYPFRYLAAEGFLPGYNFTRLPIRTLTKGKKEHSEFISRPRNIALSEFGPRNIIYHDGVKYRVDRIMLTDIKEKQQTIKISPDSGYAFMKEQLTFNIDPFTEKELTQGMDKYIHSTMIEMCDTEAKELQRITCQEEERTKKGYDIRTYFSEEGDRESRIEANVLLEGAKLLKIHFIPAARLVHVNFQWRNSPNQGYAVNVKSGAWQSQKQEDESKENESKEKVERIELFTTTTANALYIQPVASLVMGGGKDGVITLMYALKHAIENYFQVESNEIGAEIMGEKEIPNLMIYEASEGSLGVLSQIVDDPKTYENLMQMAFEKCFLDKDGIEIPEKDLKPATYDDLLSYYNQRHHSQINRNYIRETLKMLKASKIEVSSNKSFTSYEEHYKAIENAKDKSSSTEEIFLQYLKEKGLRLPDEAQPNVPLVYTKPDFFYKPNIYIYCDGTPHDVKSVQEKDIQNRKALRQAGYQVLVWYYKDSLDNFVASRPDIFKPVK